MTTGDRLDAWKAVGVISEEQHAVLTALVRRERFSVFVELSSMLYLGVLCTVGGLVWTFREYVVNLGDVAILAILTLLMVLSFGYCFTKATPYSNDEVESPSLVFDYAVYFGCLIFSATLAFIETRFGVFHGWDTHLLVAALVFGVLAYRFDNRFVLSLALSTLAGYLGLKLSMFDSLGSEGLRLLAILYGGFLIGIGWLLYRQAIKRHFFDAYLHVGGNAILLALISGVVAPDWSSLYLAGVLIAAAVSIYLGARFRKFAFVVYGTLYGYAAITMRVLDYLGSTAILLYFAVTGTAVLIGIVWLARARGRDE